LAKKQILIPITRSQSSRAILPHVQSLCPAQETELILLYITKPPRALGISAPDPGSDYALEPGGEPVGPKPYPIYAHQEEDSIQANIEAEFLPVMNHLSELGYEASLQVCFSDEPVEEIVHLTKKQDIDLIAMSTRARDGVRRFFFSDIADRVMKMVDVPVLLIHPKV
jgi:nucleotide-binding universal stress UspA family protein